MRDGAVDRILHSMEGGRAMNRQRTFEVTGTERSLPSYAELNRHVERARRLQAEATADMLRQAGRGVARAWQAARLGLAQRRQQWQTADALMRCSDRVLADVGIAREHIPLVARGIDPHTYEPMSAGLWRRWHAVRVRLDAAREARRERRQVYRELMAYNDRELEEIGVRRSDVAGIARGHLAPVPAE
jgi:uncharacterized protein YjiS (DUF1127 family)